MQGMEMLKQWFDNESVQRVLEGEGAEEGKLRFESFVMVAE